MARLLELPLELVVVHVVQQVGRRLPVLHDVRLIEHARHALAVDVGVQFVRREPRAGAAILVQHTVAALVCRKALGTHHHLAQAAL
jgi:hypothetical protein